MPSGQLECQCGADCCPSSGFLSLNHMIIADLAHGHIMGESTGELSVYFG